MKREREVPPIEDVMATIEKCARSAYRSSPLIRARYDKADLVQEGVLVYYNVACPQFDNQRAAFQTFLVVTLRTRFRKLWRAERRRAEILSLSPIAPEVPHVVDFPSRWAVNPGELRFITPLTKAAQRFWQTAISGGYDDPQKPLGHTNLRYVIGDAVGLSRPRVREICTEILDKLILFPE